MSETVTNGTAIHGEADCLALIQAVVARNIGTTPEAVAPDLPLSAVPGIESVKALRAITEIEDACHVVIPDDFLFETATVRDLAVFVYQLTQATPA
jgi:acyl carrier protein